MAAPFHGAAIIIICPIMYIMSSNVSGVVPLVPPFGLAPATPAPNHGQLCQAQHPLSRQRLAQRQLPDPQAPVHNVKPIGRRVAQIALKGSALQRQRFSQVLRRSRLRDDAQSGVPVGGFGDVV